MHSFQSFTADMLECSPFDKIGKEWMLVTAGNEEKVNTMTASWGGMGVMWGKNAAFVVIRQSRYTKEFIDREGTFSLSFLGEKHRNMLKYLGTVSGRTEDKLKEAGVEIDYQNGVPYVDQANLVLICRAMPAPPGSVGLRDSAFLMVPPLMVTSPSALRPPPMPAP